MKILTEVPKYILLNLARGCGPDKRWLSRSEYIRYILDEYFIQNPVVEDVTVKAAKLMPIPPAPVVPPVIAPVIAPPKPTLGMVGVRCGNCVAGFHDDCLDGIDGVQCGCDSHTPKVSAPYPFPEPEAPKIRFCSNCLKGEHEKCLDGEGGMLCSCKSPRDVRSVPGPVH